MNFTRATGKQTVKILPWIPPPIWASHYFEKDWQLTVNLYNSMPIALMNVVLSHLFQHRLLFLLAASALLHRFLIFLYTITMRINTIYL